MSEDRGPERDPLTEPVFGAAIEVHCTLGPGLLESVREQRGIPFERQVLLPVRSKGRDLGSELRIAVLLPGRLVVEVKAVKGILPIHEA
jgi:GxxExxY protein